MILTPDGLVLYDKEAGMTIRMDHQEARLFFKDYQPGKDFSCPEVVHAEITTRCNLECDYCYIPKETHEMDSKEWKRIFRKLGDFGIFQLTFGGGEPFLRDDVCELARYADDCGINVTVTTNGLNIDSFSVDDLSIFRQINISFHKGALAQGFDFDKAISRLRNAEIPRGINFVLSQEYLPYLQQVKEIAKRQDAVLLLLSYKPIRGDTDNCIALDVIRDYAHKFVKENLTVGIDSLVCGDCYQNERMCVISASGEVFPCSFIRTSIGNIKITTIKDIWKKRGKKMECPYLPTR